MELGRELSLPLLGEVRRAEHGEPFGVPAHEQLFGDQGGLDCFADSDVVGDEEADRAETQGHEQRHELVGARLDGDGAEGPERPGR